MKAYIIHGWDGSPQDCWIPWLKKELEAKGFEVTVPEMPDSENPKIEPWVNKLKDTIEPGDETILIGHSIGCQAIMRYMQEVNEKIKAVFFVAGFVHLNHLETEEEKIIAEPWLTRPLNWDRLKELSRFTALFSDDDPDVDVDDSEIFREKLNAKIIIEHNKGHFSDDAGVKELPSLLDEISHYA